MSDASRGDMAHAHDAASDADRDAKIEQLLLAGLDHYFAAQYDHAINIWTRALFLDRSHPRARAYIERARSALAERQRQSEELLHNGVAAFNRGEADEARRLLRAAIDSGAPTEEALALLDRLDRLEAGTASAPVAPQRRAALGGAAREGRSRSASMVALAGVFAIVVAVLAVGGYAATTRPRSIWRSLLLLQDAPPPNATAPVVREQMLPLPRRGELALVRARSLAAAGHLSDALAALDLVRPTDPQKAEADRLRSDIQRQLLALAREGGRR